MVRPGLMGFWKCRDEVPFSLGRLIVLGGFPISMSHCGCSPPSPGWDGFGKFVHCRVIFFLSAFHAVVLAKGHNVNSTHQE